MKRSLTTALVVAVCFMFTMAFSFPVEAKSNKNNAESEQVPFIKKSKIVNSFRIPVTPSVDAAQNKDDSLENLTKEIRQVASNVRNVISDQRHTYYICYAKEHWPENASAPQGPILFAKTKVGSSENPQEAGNRLVTAVQLNGGFTFHEDSPPFIWLDEKTVKKTVQRTISVLLFYFTPPPEND